MRISALDPSVLSKMGCIGNPVTVWVCDEESVCDGEVVDDLVWLGEAACDIICDSLCEAVCEALPESVLEGVDEPLNVGA